MRERAIFEAALNLTDPSQRLTYLEHACAGDATLRARIDALLVSHAIASDYLPIPAREQFRNPETALYQPGSTGWNGTHTSETEDELNLDFLAPTTRPDSLGRIGHYETLQILGKGGFGIVFRAFDEVLHRVVAVKVLSPQLAATSPARKRFLREARASAAIRHENVVQVYEVGETPLPYIVMEFVPGETLHQRHNRMGPVEVVEVLRIGKQLAEGLAAAHATDLIHRDIKPANILIEGVNLKVRITDFGLARAADDASLSRSGLVGGTPMYMSPEQANGEKLDHRTDLFSLGSVLYQIITGRPPFRAEGTMAVMKRVIEDTPRPIREIIPETPQWLCDIVSKLHEKKPENRFPSARELADVLALCEVQLQANAKVAGLTGLLPNTSSTRAGWSKAIAFAVLLTVVGILIALFWPKGSASIPPVSSPSSQLDPPAITPKSPVKKSGNSSFTEADIERIATLLPEDQIAEVGQELKRLNPMFDAPLRFAAQDRTVVEVNLDGPSVSDLSPLRALRSLRKLTIKKLPTADFHQLVGLQLNDLALWNCTGVNDLTPLMGMPLERLWLNMWAGNDLRPLQAMPLKVLKLQCLGQWLDLTQIQMLALGELTLENTKVADLVPLQGMPLKKLEYLSGNVTDLTPLAGLPLTELDLRHTKVSDLTPLAGMRLDELSVEHTLVSSFAPLKGMPLRRLYWNGCQVTDLSPLKEMPLRTITCGVITPRDAEILRGIRLKTINDLPAAEFWRKFEAKPKK